MHSYVMQFERLPAAGTDRCPPRQASFFVAEPLILEYAVAQTLEISDILRVRLGEIWRNANAFPRRERFSIPFSDQSVRFRNILISSTKGLNLPITYSVQGVSGDESARGYTRCLPLSNYRMRTEEAERLGLLYFDKSYQRNVVFKLEAPLT